MTVTIRPARPEEYGELGDLVVRAYRTVFTEGLGDYEEDLRDSRRRAEEAELLVAADADGRLVATVTYVPDGGPWSEIAGENEAEFRMLAVAPEARGRGVGRQLVEHVLADARRRGRSALVLSSSERMVTAHRLYERLGFRRTPERDWFPLPGFRLVTYGIEL